MIIQKNKLFIAGVLLIVVLSGCLATTSDYNRFNTEPNIPKGKIAIIACDPVYADSNDPWISLLYLSIRSINGIETKYSVVKSKGMKYMGPDWIGWWGTTELMPGQYEICIDMRYTYYGFNPGYNKVGYIHSTDCMPVRFEAQAGHTYVVSPEINLVNQLWKPVINDITESTDSIKQWIDERVAAELGAPTTNINNHPLIKDSSSPIKVSNISNPGQRPRPEDWLLATQTLEDGSSFELKFRFDPTKGYTRVFGSGLSFSEYIILYSKDGQSIESIYKIIQDAKTDKGRLDGLQEVGSNELVVIKHSSPRSGIDIYIRGNDGKYKFKETREPNINGTTSE